MFGTNLATQLVDELRRHDRPMTPRWPTEPRVLARDLSVVNAVHVVEMLPGVLDTSLEEDALALALRTSIAALGLTRVSDAGTAEDLLARMTRGPVKPTS